MISYPISLGVRYWVAKVLNKKKFYWNTSMIIDIIIGIFLSYVFYSYVFGMRTRNFEGKDELVCILNAESFLSEVLLAKI